MAAAEQDLLGADETVTEEARLFLGEDKHASRTISKRFLRVTGLLRYPLIRTVLSLGQ